MNTSYCRYKQTRLRRLPPKKPPNCVTSQLPGAKGYKTTRPQSKVQYMHIQPGPRFSVGHLHRLARAKTGEPCVRQFAKRGIWRVARHLAAVHTKRTIKLYHQQTPHHPAPGLDRVSPCFEQRLRRSVFSYGSVGCCFHLPMCLWTFSSPLSSAH